MKKIVAAGVLALALLGTSGQSARAGASWFDVTLGPVSFGLEGCYLWGCKECGHGCHCKAWKVFTHCCYQWSYPTGHGWAAPGGFDGHAVNYYGGESAPQQQASQPSQQPQTTGNAGAGYQPVGYYYPSYGYYPPGGYGYYYPAPAYWSGR